MMTPQLFINYKLKSVAHLPWRMMTYKALNTFIDDIFAFVIKMPTMYRLGCFRDDIVFFIFLYQKYIYKVSLTPSALIKDKKYALKPAQVDPTRVNEFGYSGEMIEEAEKKKQDQAQQQPAIASDKPAENGQQQRPKSPKAKKTD